MIKILIEVGCDFCRQYKRKGNSVSDEASSPEAFRELIAEQLGWSMQEGWHGKPWDCCRECAQDGTKELAVSPERAMEVVE